MTKVWPILFTSVIALMFAPPACANGAAGGHVRVDPEIRRVAIGAEHVEVTVLMVPDRTPKPFALPRRVRTEEGRAWGRSLVAELRGLGIGVVHDFGDGSSRRGCQGGAWRTRCTLWSAIPAWSGCS
jgi:hypothetical protein